MRVYEAAVKCRYEEGLNTVEIPNPTTVLTPDDVGREMYDRPYDVEISADLKFTSTSQRISEADALVQLPQAVPELAGNFAFKHAVISKAFEARNRFDLIGLMGQPPPPPEMFGLPTSPPAPPPGMAPPGAPPPGAPPGPPPANNQQQGAA